MDEKVIELFEELDSSSSSDSSSQPTPAMVGEICSTPPRQVRSIALIPARLIKTV